MRLRDQEFVTILVEPRWCRTSTGARGACLRILIFRSNSFLLASQHKANLICRETQHEPLLAAAPYSNWNGGTERSREAAFFH